jgi:hypothetical protein
MSHGRVDGRGARSRSSRSRAWRVAVVGAGAAFLVATAAPVRAESRTLGGNFGLGLVAGFGTLVYFPVKMTYSMIGGLIGGLTYLVTLANEDTANAVWEPTLGGTYVLTPDMIAGDEPVEFVGSSTPHGKDASTKGQWPE